MPRNTPKTKQAKQTKMRKIMREYRAGTLHSGKNGKVVKSRKQAVAIGLSQSGMNKPKRVPKGYHRMPDGSIMKGSRHK